MTNTETKYWELYNQLGDRLLEVIDKMKSAEEGVRKKPNDQLKLGGNASGFAAKVQLRLKILSAEGDLIRTSISTIKPMAEYERRIKELETKEKELNGLIKEFEARKNDK